MNEPTHAYGFFTDGIFQQARFRLNNGETSFRAGDACVEQLTAERLIHVLRQDQQGMIKFRALRFVNTHGVGGLNTIEPIERHTLNTICGQEIRFQSMLS